MNNVPCIHISVSTMVHLSWVIADPFQLLFATAILCRILTCWVCFEAILRHISGQLSFQTVSQMPSYRTWLKHHALLSFKPTYAVSVSICRCQRVYFELNMKWQYLNMCFQPVRMLLYLQILPSPGSSE